MPAPSAQDKHSKLTIEVNPLPSNNGPASTINHHTRNLVISDFVGQYGLYQLSLTTIAFIRYICTAMMTNSGPLMAPELDYSCQLPPTFNVSRLDKPTDVPLSQLLKGKCYLRLVDGHDFRCTQWTYDTSKHGTTLTDSYNLICDRDWLRSTFQSTVSLGVVISSVIWGSISDKHGRYFAIKCSFILALLAGLISYTTADYLTFAVTRSLCSFADLGLVVSLTTMIVETLDNYRGSTCMIVYTGWSVGVMIMPYIAEYFRDFKLLTLFTVALNVLTLPWLLTTSESVRWLMVNGRFTEAQGELKRICSWNMKSAGDVYSEKFDTFKRKFVQISAKNSPGASLAPPTKFQVIGETLFGGLSKVGQLFASRQLAVATVTLIWVTFNSEFFYMLFILINSDIGDDPKLNYAIGGLMELLATVIGLIVISKMTRKTSLVATTIIISLLCFMLSLTYDNANASIWFLNLTKLAISTLSSLVYVTTIENFPTNLRQTGFGLTGTLGSLGAVVAPYVRTELVDLIGMGRVLYILTLFPLTVAAIIPKFLRETKDVELPDFPPEEEEKEEEEDDEDEAEADDQP